MQPAGLRPATGASCLLRKFATSGRFRAQARARASTVLVSSFRHVPNKEAASNHGLSAKLSAGLASLCLGLLPLVDAYAAQAADSAFIGGAGGGSASLQERVAELRMFQNMFGGRSSPTQQLAADVQAVQGVVQRAELLLRAGDARGARALLSQQGREVGKLSYGLGFGTEAYRLLPAEAGRQVLSKLETARAALAAAEAAAAADAAESSAVERRGDTVGANGGSSTGLAADGDGREAPGQGVDVATWRLREVGALLKTVADYLEAAGD